MKWWVFNEEQLDEALVELMRGKGAAGAVLSYAPASEIKAFLESDIARAHGMRGDNEP